MKKVTLLLSCLIALFICQNVSAQSSSLITTLMYENFDNPNNIQMTSHSTSGLNSWAINWKYVTPPHSDSARVFYQDTVYLTSPKFYIDTFNSVSIEFDHVAKVDEFDNALVQVSFDSVTWINLTENSHQGPTRLLPYGTSGIKYLFAEQSAIALNNNMWKFGVATWAPTQPSDFVHEIFEISNVIENYNGPTDSLIVRFMLGDDTTKSDLPNNPNRGRVGWFIDNIDIKGSKCRLVAPTLDLTLPNNYIQQYIGSVYHEGPFDFNVDARDAEGVKHVKLYYSVKDSGTTFWKQEDTITFNNVTSSQYYAEIPILNKKDSVKWRIEAMDITLCENVSVIPATGYNYFEVRQKLPAGCSSTPVNVYPYFEDFNSQVFIKTGAPPNDPLYRVPLAKKWENAFGDHFDWWVWNGATPTSGTGPTNDVPGGGKYLYAEATGNLAPSVANLKSPCIDLYEIANPNVSFYVNTYGQSNGYLHLDLHTFSGPITKDIVPPIKTSSNQNWVKVEANLYPFRNKIVQLRFRAHMGSNDLSDIAIDSVQIYHTPLLDLDGMEVFVSEFSPEDSIDEYEIIVRNVGVRDIDSGWAYLNINGSNFLDSGKWYQHIPAGGTDTVKVKSSTPNPRGVFSVQAVVHLLDTGGVKGDKRPKNDTTGISFGRGLPNIDLINYDVYHDNFEDTDTLWSAAPFNSNNKNQWELGYPNYAQTTGVFEGDRAWDLSLNTPNANNEESSYLISPFMNLTATDELVIAFQKNLDIDVTDLLFIEYSVDRGESWKKFEILDPKEKNWYNNNVLTPDNELTEGWSGSTWTLPPDGQVDVWEYTEFLMQDFNNEAYKEEVLFRFNYYDKADAIQFGGSGASIDDIRFIDMNTYDAMPLEIHNPYSDCRLGTQEKVVVVLENFGIQHLDTIPVRVDVYKNGVFDHFREEKVHVDFETRELETFELESTLDLSTVGAMYRVEVITRLGPDQNRNNDTLVKMVENIDGCMMNFKFDLYARGPGYYQIYVNNKIPEYPAYLNFRDLPPNQPGVDLDTSYCARNGGFVDFKLVDQYSDSTVGRYSIINELTGQYIRKNIIGGWGTVPVSFYMDCPYESDAILTDVNVLGAGIKAPVAKYYALDIIYENKGIFDIHTIDVNVQIDQGDVMTRGDTNNPPLIYGESKRMVFDSIYIEPGVHTISVWTSNPNGLPDEYQYDDTVRMSFDIVDTAYVDICNDGFFTDFESNARPQWLSFNPYDYSDRSLFEKGTPNKGNMQGAFSGNNAWVTDLDNEYRAFDSSSLVSPIFHFESDVCYSVSFYHKYSFDDILHDGGHIQYSLDTGRTWKTIYPKSGSNYAMNWYGPTDNVAAIPDNSNNGGWSGIQDSVYVFSRNLFGSTVDQHVMFRFRFESDGSPNGDGWSIDDFSISCVAWDDCFTVGSDELLSNSFLVGQNRPNPFNDQTEIPLYLPTSGMVDVTILNVLGQPVYQSQENMGEGEHFIQLKTDEWASGMYYYSVLFDGQKVTRKMMITR